MPEERVGGLNKLLQDFGSDTGITSCAIVSKDGLIMASELHGKFDENTLAANAARLLFLGGTTGTELQRGNLKQILLKYDHGFVALSVAGEFAAIVALVPKESDLDTGALLYALTLLGNKVKSLLEGWLIIKKNIGLFFELIKLYILYFNVKVKKFYLNNFNLKFDDIFFVFF